MKSWFMDLMFETRIKSVWVKVESLTSVFGLLDLLWSPWSSVEAFRCVVLIRWHHNVSQNTCRCGLTDVASVIITQWNQDDHIQFLLTIKFSQSRRASRPELQTCCSSSITRASRFLYLTDSEGNNLNRLLATIFLFFTTKLFNSSLWAFYLKHKYCRDSSAGFSRKTGRLICFSRFPGRVGQHRCESERHGYISGRSVSPLRICSVGGGFLGLEGVIRLKNGV